MKILILTNGDYGDYSFCKSDMEYDYVICADNGIHHANKLGIKPNLIVGDLDSATSDDIAEFKARGIEIMKYPCEKDATDTEIAIHKAIELGARYIDVYGGLGTRLDHTLGNVHLLYQMLAKGIRGRLINSYNEVVLAEKELVVDGQKGQLVSLIPFLGEVKGITTTGLAYSLTDSEVPIGTSLGVSNYMVGDSATIKIKQGILLVIKARD